MGIRRERAYFANILHLDPCGSPSPPRRNTGHCLSDRRDRHACCTRQPYSKSRTNLDNTPPWNCRGDVLRVLREDRPVRTSCLASISLRRGTYSNQYDSGRGYDWNRWVRHRKNSHDDLSTSFPYLLRFLRWMGSYHDDLRQRDGTRARRHQETPCIF